MWWWIRGGEGGGRKRESGGRVIHKSCRVGCKEKDVAVDPAGSTFNVIPRKLC